MTTQFYVLKRYGKAYEEVEQAEMREPEIPLWAEWLIWAGSMIFAIGMGWIAYHMGTAVWHALVALGKGLMDLL